MSGKLDPIAVIETAYALEPSEPEWLERLGASLAPVLDHSYGVVAGTYVLDGPRTRYGTRIGVGVPAEVMRAGEADPSLAQMLETLFSTPSSFASLSGVEPDLAANLRRRVPEVQDAIGLLARHSPTEGLFVSAATPAPHRIPARRRRHLDRLAAHLEAGHRLRTSLGSDAGGAEEAVLTSDGRLLHAQDGARDRTARERLREAVRNMDRARGRMRSSAPDEAVELWPALVSARWSLLDSFESDGKRYVVAIRNPVPEAGPPGLTDREAAVVHHTALGRSHGEVAYALGISPSTVRAHLVRAMRKLRVRRRSELVALHASQQTLEPMGELPALAMASSTLRDTSPPESLTTAERDVLARILRGESNAAIARARGVSYRTVANQVSSVFRKYGVRDREQLVATARGLSPQA